MKTFDIVLTNHNPKYKDFIQDSYSYVYFLQRTGQILERVQYISKQENKLTIAVVCPEEKALAIKNCSSYAVAVLQKIEKNSKSKIKYIPTGIEPDFKDVAIPNKSSYYILRYGWSSPLICGDTFREIPLYKIPYTDTDKKGYDNINFWNKDYRSIYGLWISGTYENFALEELQNVHSKINKKGRELTQIIEKLTGIPTYYFLFNYRDWSKKEDLERKCPLTKKTWYINRKTSDDFIAFKCTSSRLVSELSTNVSD